MTEALVLYMLVEYEDTTQTIYEIGNLNHLSECIKNNEDKLIKIQEIESCMAHFLETTVIADSGKSGMSKVLVFLLLASSHDCDDMRPSPLREKLVNPAPTKLDKLNTCIAWARELHLPDNQRVMFILRCMGQ